MIIKRNYKIRKQSYDYFIIKDLVVFKLHSLSQFSLTKIKCHLDKIIQFNTTLYLRNKVNKTL